MILWIDAQLSPAIANWISVVLTTPAVPLRDINLRDATDREIFLAARREGAIVMTKDGDFVRLLKELGAPPKVIWITCGNTSNEYLRQILLNALPQSLQLLQSGEDLVEIG
jgi:predicted nuclease of predicted toxin-antitoxin system